MTLNDRSEGIQLYRRLIETATAEEELRNSAHADQAVKYHARARGNWYMWVEQHSVQETEEARSECRRLFPEVFTAHEELTS